MPKAIISRLVAYQRGEKRYFTGKRCKHGHLSERYVRGSVCCECQRLASAKYKPKPIGLCRLTFDVHRGDVDALEAFVRQLNIVRVGVPGATRVVAGGRPAKPRRETSKPPHTGVFVNGFELSPAAAALHQSKQLDCGLCGHPTRPGQACALCGTVMAPDISY